MTLESKSKVSLSIVIFELGDYSKEKVDAYYIQMISPRRSSRKATQENTQKSEQGAHEPKTKADSPTSKTPDEWEVTDLRKVGNYKSSTSKESGPFVIKLKELIMKLFIQTVVGHDPAHDMTEGRFKPSSELIKKTTFKGILGATKREAIRLQAWRGGNGQDLVPGAPAEQLAYEA